MKAAQMGGSEAVRSYIGWRADQDPCPIAYVLPSRTKVNGVFRDDLQPMFFDSPPLARLLTGSCDDVTKERIALRNNVVIQGVWAGSPFETHPYGVISLDELDRYPRCTGRGNDTASQAAVRVRTYGSRARLIRVSTPATRLDLTAQAFDAADYRLYFLVPCPHCGKRISLDFANLKFAPPIPGEDKHTHAARVRSNYLAWYVCQECGGRIEDADRWDMVQAGAWATTETRPATATSELDRIITTDAEQVERFPARTRLAFQLSSLYAVWPGHHWADTAAKFIEATGDRDAMLDFRTLELGLPFEVLLHRLAVGTFADKVRRADLPEGVMPAWADTLLAAIDMQDTGFYIEVRAFGAWPRSARVWHGYVTTWADVERICRTTYYKVEGDAFPAQCVSRAVIDTGGTGTRTMECYHWVRSRLSWITPIKGAAQAQGTLHAWPGKGWLDAGKHGQAPKKKGKHIDIWRIDSHHWHDLLADLITRGIDDPDVPEVWHLNTRDDPTYNLQMSNLHKTIVFKGGRQLLRWLPVTPAARHDYRDCGAYLIFLAYHIGLDQQTEEGIHRWQETQRARAKAIAKPRKQKPKQNPWEPRNLGGEIR